MMGVPGALVGDIHIQLLARFDVAFFSGNRLQHIRVVAVLQGAFQLLVFQLLLGDLGGKDLLLGLSLPDLAPQVEKRCAHVDQQDQNDDFG